MKWCNRRHVLPQRYMIDDSGGLLSNDEDYLVRTHKSTPDIHYYLCDVHKSDTFSGGAN
jgi:hypothetical protein